MKTVFNNIEDIKQAVKDGKPVRWSNDGYHIKHNKGKYGITFIQNGSTIGLTNLAGDKLNGKLSDFYIQGE